MEVGSREGAGLSAPNIMIDRKNRGTDAWMQTNIAMIVAKNILQDTRACQSFETHSNWAGASRIANCPSKDIMHRSIMSASRLAKCPSKDIVQQINCVGHGVRRQATRITFQAQY